MLKKISPLLLLCSFGLCAAPGPLKAPVDSTTSTTNTTSTTSTTSTPPQVVAVDDTITVMPNSVSSVEGDVTDNDMNGKSVYLNSTPASQYGALLFNSDGSFTYKLYENSPSIINLVAGQVVTDSFAYTLTDQYGQSATAKLNVTIIGNPVDADGNTIYEKPQDVLYDNVDVEFNDSFADATPLNSGRNIKGHLYYSGDKDWYYLHSAGNEIIKLDVCPQGSSCFGKKSWVLYVFDSAQLIPEMEELVYPFRRWVTETGAFLDNVGYSNHLYLAYEMGFFDGALIGIVDPCFDTSNSVEIGVGPGERNYLIAISSPLMGSDDAGKPAGECGVNTTVLQKAGRPVAGVDADGKPKNYATTEEYITVFPFSDDQYTINITSTGLDPLSPSLNPLLSSSASEKSPTFNGFTGELNIPKVKVNGKLYGAQLVRQGPSSNNTYNFALSSLNELGPEAVTDPFQATYNPANQQVLFPRVTDAASGGAYSVVMQYHPAANGNAEWLEAIAITPIQ